MIAGKGLMLAREPIWIRTKTWVAEIRVRFSPDLRNRRNLRFSISGFWFSRRFGDVRVRGRRGMWRSHSAATGDRWSASEARRARRISSVRWSEAEPRECKKATEP